MARKKKKLSEAGDASVPISAMIDVVFLLIIFFVVTASIDKDVEDEKVKLSKAPHGKPLTKKAHNSITINVHKDGLMNIGMMPVNKEQISSILTSSAAKYGSEIPIIIRGDQDTQHHYIKQVLEAVQKTGLYHVKFNAVIED